MSNFPNSYLYFHNNTYKIVLNMEENFPEENLNLGNNDNKYLYILRLG